MGCSIQRADESEGCCRLEHCSGPATAENDTGRSKIVTSRSSSERPDQHFEGGKPDFDKEAEKLFARLNLEEKSGTRRAFNPLDALWRHPVTGCTFYVGNHTAASNVEMLRSLNITHVVNCTENMPNFHEQPGSQIKYFRFNIESHRAMVSTETEALLFVQPMLAFVEKALGSGHNVLAHCLAGAHRAGTTGIICIMYFVGLPDEEAIVLAKRCRPIIDPIFDFKLLLQRLSQSFRALSTTGAYAPNPAQDAVQQRPPAG